MQATAVAPSVRWKVSDVAAYLGVSEKTVYNLVRRSKELREADEPGGIPFYKPRGSSFLRFKPEEVKAWFEGEEGEK